MLFHLPKYLTDTPERALITSQASVAVANKHRDTFSDHYAYFSISTPYSSSYSSEMGEVIADYILACLSVLPSDKGNRFIREFIEINAVKLNSLIEEDLYQNDAFPSSYSSYLISTSIEVGAPLGEAAVSKAELLGLNVSKLVELSRIKELVTQIHDLKS